MSPNRMPLPPDPQALRWADRGGLLASRAAAIEVLSRRSMALRDMLWSSLATAVVSGGWGVLCVAAGWYSDLDDPGGAELGVVFVVMAIALFAMGMAVVGFLRVRRRGSAAQSLLQAWTALDRRPEARSLPPGDIPQPLASTWDLSCAGQPWKETVPLSGRRYLVFLSGKSLVWMVLPSAPLMFGAVIALAALTGEPARDDNGTVIQLGMVGVGVLLVSAGLWGLGKALRHYTWALSEARARVTEEKAWPPTRWDR